MSVSAHQEGQASTGQHGLCSHWLAQPLLLAVLRLGLHCAAAPRSTLGAYPCWDPCRCYGEKLCQPATKWGKQVILEGAFVKLQLPWAYITLGLGRGMLSLKLTNLFPGSSWVYVFVLLPIQSLSQIFWGFIPSSNLIPFPNQIPPLCGCHFGSYCTCAQQRILPLLVLPPLGNL